MRPDEYSRVTPQRPFSISSVATLNGNRYVGYLYKDGSKRNANLNYFNNEWNGNYRFLGVRHYLVFSRVICSGVFCCVDFFHPPSC